MRNKIIVNSKILIKLFFKPKNIVYINGVIAGVNDCMNLIYDLTAGNEALRRVSKVFDKIYIETF